MARQNPRRPKRNFRSGKRLNALTKRLINRKLSRSVSIFDKDEAEDKVMNCDYLLESDRIDLINSMNLN